MPLGATLQIYAIQKLWRSQVVATLENFAFYNLLDLGAVGDSTVTGGGTDDTAAIQAVLNTISAAGGGALYIPPDHTFRITAPLTYSGSNLKAFGLGESSRILIDSATLDGFQISGSGQCVEFDSFEIRNNDSLTPSAGKAISFTGTTFEPEVMNMSLRNNFNPISVVGTSNVSTINGPNILNCQLRAVHGIGINLSNTVGPRIFRVLIDESGTSGTAGVNVADGVQDLVAIDVGTLSFDKGWTFNSGTVLASDLIRCVADGARTTCLEVIRGDDLTCTSCWVGSPKAGAVGISIGGGAPHLFSFRNGNIANVARQGIILFNDAVDTTIDENEIYNCGLDAANTYDAISIQANTNNFYIRGNTITNSTIFTGTQRFGIVVNNGTSANVQIKNNNVAGNGTGGIADGATGANVEVTGNLGYNPVAAAGIAAGASPWTYTAGHAPETFYLIGGTVTAVVVSGVGISGLTNRTVVLPANGQVTVTYTVAPTALIVAQ